MRDVVLLKPVKKYLLASMFKNVKDEPVVEKLRKAVDDSALSGLRG